MRRVVIYRLTNVFGKWSRPNYNSVVATFCHNIAHDLPITISDPEREIELVYIDDVVQAFLRRAERSAVSGQRPERQAVYREVTPVYRSRWARLAELIRSFRGMRRDAWSYPTLG